MKQRWLLSARGGLFLVAMLAACNGSDSTNKPGNGNGTEVEALDPGTRVLQRVNAVEYDTIMKDLVGTTLTPGQNFPADELAYGFDNIAIALTTTSTHVELWEGAADAILSELFTDDSEETLSYTVQAEAGGVTYTGVAEAYDDTSYAIFDGGMSTAFSIAYDGTFEITVSAWGRPADFVSPTVEFRVDGAPVGSVEVTAVGGVTALYTVQAAVDAGLHTFEFAIANPSDDLKRALVIDKALVKGPLDPETGRPVEYDQLVPCAPDGDASRDCAAQVIPTFGRLAWRRALTQEDIDWALALYDAADAAGLDGTEALQYAFKGILMSPDFLYRVEGDPQGSAKTVQLTGYEMATRLAAFVWSSTPDDSLLAAAEAGALDTPEGVKAQLKRMLADKKADALLDNLAGQWFAIRKLQQSQLDVLVYPEYSSDLRDSMVEELKLVMEQFFRDDVPLDQVLTQQSTWVDARLAALYGVPFEGDEGDFVQVSTEGTPRYGLFGTAGWLMANSRTNAPSAVRRGKWIVENLLCSAPPPPPPDVEGMVTIVPDGLSVREQEETQRSDDYCQGCHGQMDPIGWSLHGFAADGSVRAVDELGFPIDDDASWNGVEFDGAANMATAVASDARLADCVAEKAFTYALGRGVRVEDGPMLESISAQFIANGQKFDALAEAIVTSDAFRMRGVPEVE